MPELTMEQKAQILLHQRQSLTLQVTIGQLQKQLEAMPAQLNALLTKFCKDLEIDPSDFTFDLDKLILIAKPKTAGDPPPESAPSKAL